MGWSSKKRKPVDDRTGGLGRVKRGHAPSGGCKEQCSAVGNGGAKKVSLQGEGGGGGGLRGPFLGEHIRGGKGPSGKIASPLWGDSGGREEVKLKRALKHKKKRRRKNKRGPPTRGPRGGGSALVKKGPRRKTRRQARLRLSPVCGKKNTEGKDTLTNSTLSHPGEKNETHCNRGIRGGREDSSFKKRGHPRKDPVGRPTDERS